MPKTIYAMSDIHGHLHLLRAALDMIDLDTDVGAQLVLLGDYINRGPDSAGVLTAVRELTQRWPDRVVALLGNHEVDFMEWLDGDDDQFDWLTYDRGFETTRSFLSDEALRQAIGTQGADGAQPTFETMTHLNARVKQALRTSHSELLAWLRPLPLSYQVDDLVFVHAGVDEEADDLWLAATPDMMFTHKFPPTMGPFRKTVIAGHVGTFNMHDDGSHGSYFDGASHYYIDSTVGSSGQLNILKYTTATKRFDYLVAEA